MYQIYFADAQSLDSKVQFVWHDGVVVWALDSRSRDRRFKSHPFHLHVSCSYTCASVSIIWYWPNGGDLLAGKVTTGLAESNGSDITKLLNLTTNMLKFTYKMIKFTCGLTA